MNERFNVKEKLVVKSKERLIKRPSSGLLAACSSQRAFAQCRRASCISSGQLIAERT